MSLYSLNFLSRWWVRTLINALLRPMFCRYRVAREVGRTAAAERYQRLFDRMLSACNCYPFCIEVDEFGFWVLDEPSERDMWEDYS